MSKAEVERAAEKLIAEAPKYEGTMDQVTDDWARVSLLVSGDLNVRVVTNAYRSLMALTRSLCDLENAMQEHRVKIMLGDRVFDGFCTEEYRQVRGAIIRAAYKRMRYYEYWTLRYFRKLPEPEASRVVKLAREAGGWLSQGE